MLALVDTPTVPARRPRAYHRRYRVSAPSGHRQEIDGTGTITPRILPRRSIATGRDRPAAILNGVAGSAGQRSKDYNEPLKFDARLIGSRSPHLNRSHCSISSQKIAAK